MSYPLSGGVVKITGTFYRGDRFYLPASGAWLTAGAVAITYFLAARLGLALLSQPSDVAVFWPASGIAAGIMILSSRRAGTAVAIGVIIGTVAANLMSDRSLWTSLFKGFCNAGEAAFVAGLIERWFGRPFAFDDLYRVLGFVAAACLGAAASALGGAATMTLLHTSAPFWDVWRAWFLSDGVGIVMVVPLVIGIGQVWRIPPSRAESIEALWVLSFVVLISWYAVTHPTGSWLSFDPDAVVLPLLLWLVARCKLIFGITGAFIVSLTVIYATIFGIGHLGDAAVPLVERVSGAQVVIVMVTLYTLVLGALFAQRRESEAQLAKKSAALTRLHEISSRLWVQRDLHQALDEILAGAIELLGADMGTIRIWDRSRGVLKIEVHRGFKQTFLDSYHEVSAEKESAWESTLRSGRRMVIEDVEVDASYAPLRPIARAAGYRAIQLTPIMNRGGAPLGMLSTNFRSVHKSVEQDLRLLDLYVRQAADIIERHKAEDALRESEERLRLAQLSTGVGIWDRNPRTGKVFWTAQLEAIFGLEPGNVKSYADFRERVHHDDIEAFEAARDAAVRRHETFSFAFRIVRPNGQVRWVSCVGGASYDEATGEPVRILGNMTDVTERKLAELALAERNAQLGLASRTAGVGSFAIDFSTGLASLSPGCATILGLPESTVVISRDAARKLVHPEDLAQLLDAPRDRAFLKKQREFIAQFRIIRADDGDVRWIEARSLIIYDDGARPLRLIAVIIDITERKLAEQALAERNAQLALAGRAVLVGTYAYDVKKGVVQVSEGYAAIHGLPEGTTETLYSGWRTRVHPEDLAGAEGVRDQAFANRREEDNAEYRIVLPTGEVRWIERRGSISYDGNGRPERVVGVNIDVTERKRAEERQRALVAELDHRVKNALATVSSVVSQSAVGSGSVANFVAALDGRIRSMATTHELLSSSRWQGISLTRLVQRELAPYATRHNSEIKGPEVVLRPEAGQATAMVLHELATNAAKYGALSTSNGRVSIRWHRRMNGQPRPSLVLEWQEMDGPPVVATGKASYGTSTIRELIPYEFGGAVELVLAPDGVRCRLELPADWLSGERQPFSETVAHALPRTGEA
jgi:PAS domain S-box-containing protein